jgi:Helicase associated domain
MSTRQPKRFTREASLPLLGDHVCRRRCAPKLPIVTVVRPGTIPSIQGTAPKHRRASVNPYNSPPGCSVLTVATLVASMEADLVLACANSAKPRCFQSNGSRFREETMEESRVRRLPGEEEEEEQEERGAATQSNLALNEEKWEAMLGRLRAFKQQFGHTQIPYRYPADPQLGRWGKFGQNALLVGSIDRPALTFPIPFYRFHRSRVVSVQRSLYKRIEDGSGKSNTTLTSERIQKLNDIDFEWVARDHRTVPWEARYQELVAFVRRYGHSQVPIGWEVRTQVTLQDE